METDSAAPHDSPAMLGAEGTEVNEAGKMLVELHACGGGR